MSYKDQYKTTEKHVLKVRFKTPLLFLSNFYTPRHWVTPLLEGIFLMDTLQRVPTNKKGLSPLCQAIRPYLFFISVKNSSHQRHSFPISRLSLSRVIIFSFFNTIQDKSQQKSVPFPSLKSANIEFVQLRGVILQNRHSSCFLF